MSTQPILSQDILYVSCRNSSLYRSNVVCNIQWALKIRPGSASSKRLLVGDFMLLYVLHNPSRFEAMRVSAGERVLSARLYMPGTACHRVWVMCPVPIFVAFASKVRLCLQNLNETSINVTQPQERSKFGDCCRWSHLLNSLTSLRWNCETSRWGYMS